MTNRRSLVMVALCMLASTACDNSTPPNTAGTLTAVLVSPNGAEGAAILDVAGTVESFGADTGITVFTTPSATGTRVIVVRMTPGELSVRLALEDVSKPPTVSVVEVADGDDKLRQSLSGYRVELR